MYVKPNFKSGINHWYYPSMTIRGGWIYSWEWYGYIEIVIWKWVLNIGLTIGRKE